LRVLRGAIAATVLATAALAQPPAASDEALLKAVQNPVASLISVPFQDNLNFPIGPYDRTQNVLNIQPVIPVALNSSWNLITRIIIPVVSQPAAGSPNVREDGLGDLNPTFFFSPVKVKKLIWGVGPTFSLRTETHSSLGNGKWGAGPAVVALVQPGKWTLGALANNIWSFAGDKDRPDVNAFLMQYFVNYNLPKSWYLTSSPIVTANWNAPGADRWVVPFGGGFGRIFKAGHQPMNAQINAYYNAVRPDSIPYPTWSLRFQLALLFPK
jgi:hypothetical protein